MPDYSEMYYELFNKVTDTIEALKQIQQHTEEMCMKNDGAQVVLLRSASDDAAEGVKPKTPGFDARPCAVAQRSSRD